MPETRRCAKRLGKASPRPGGVAGPANAPHRAAARMTGRPPRRGRHRRPGRVDRRCLPADRADSRGMLQ
ncbi:hypothetical protein C7S16_2393 [Burkholderia thailandensis]|uniref:Uncharacterized protein n=1 Tax=Burkholderia thailandensis TaxID=57975 RepID=A0AAW9CY27_BURTH|nr:hypothetical protein [Burkholderia thailandensis]MDW9253968.1 hypothetical protein [Burkholderia thailandensis]